MAPKGCENLFVLVPVAAGLDDSDAIREKLYNDVLGHFENIIGEPIRPHVTVKRIASHRDQISLYHSYLGSALGLSHSLWQTAIFRPSHRSRKVKNLFYTGHDTHPGIGMPMVLISAQIVAKIMGGQHE